MGIKDVSETFKSLSQEDRAALWLTDQALRQGLRDLKQEDLTFIEVED
jgi:hypothetical protein